MAIPMFPPRPTGPEGKIGTASLISQLQPPSRSELVSFTSRKILTLQVGNRNRSNMNQNA